MRVCRWAADRFSTSVALPLRLSRVISIGRVGPRSSLAVRTFPSTTPCSGRVSLMKSPDSRAHLVPSRRRRSLRRLGLAGWEIAPMRKQNEKSPSRAPSSCCGARALRTAPRRSSGSCSWRANVWSSQPAARAGTERPKPVFPTSGGRFARHSALQVSHCTERGGLGATIPAGSSSCSMFPARWRRTPGRFCSSRTPECAPSGAGKPFALRRA